LCNIFKDDTSARPRISGLPEGGPRRQEGRKDAMPAFEFEPGYARLEAALTRRSTEIPFIAQLHEFAMKETYRRKSVV
jgi:hypothetical protein